MTTTILARVRRVMRGHSDRALIVAVDEAGLEQKIEVPLEAVRAVADGGEHVLMLTWSLHVLPPAPQPQAPAASPATPEPASTHASPTPPAATAGSAHASPSAVDQQFMALMSRHNSAAAPATSSPTISPSTDSSARPGEQLAALLGIGRAPS